MGIKQTLETIGLKTCRLVVSCTARRRNVKSGGEMVACSAYMFEKSELGDPCFSANHEARPPQDPYFPVTFLPSFCRTLSYLTLLQPLLSILLAQYGVQSCCIGIRL
jgi:hypothetical protein